MPKGKKYQDCPLMKTNTTTAIPRLRFPEFCESEGWRIGKVQDLGQVITGNTPKTADRGNYGGNKLFVSPADMNETRYITSTKTKITIEGWKQVRPIGVGSTLFVCIGSTIGKVSQTKVECATNQQINAVVPYAQNVNDFVYSVLEKYSTNISEIAGNHAVPIINKKLFSLEKIYIPKLPEQQKIANCLSSLDHLIDAEIQELNTIKDHKAGLLQNLFPVGEETVPKYRFAEFEGDGNWESFYLTDIADNLDSKRVPITSKDRLKGQIPYYGASGIIDYVQNYIFDDNLLCVSEDGANLIDRVYPIAFSVSGKSWINNHAHVLKFNNVFTQVLVQSYLNSISLEQYLTGVAQPKLNKAKLNSISIPLPRVEEQKKIAECLSSLDNFIQAKDEKIKTLKEHKQGLMQQLFPVMGDK